MALVKGTNCGFVTEAPDGDPAELVAAMDGGSKALKDTSPAGAVKVVEIGWWCNTASEEANFEVGIYDNNVGDDNPEALIGSDTTNAKGTGTGWKRCTGLNIEITPETIYWIAVQLDDVATTTRNGYKVDAGEKTDLKTVQTELTDPWGASGFTDGHLTAFYAVWESAGVGAVNGFGCLSKETMSGEQTPGIYN